MRRQLVGSAYGAETRRGLQEDLDFQRDGDKITVFLRRILPRGDIDAFISAASSFGLRYDVSYIPAMDFMMQVPESSSRRERIVRKRTSEQRMRIAALQVAASKPHGKATTTELKNEVDRYVALTSEDRLPSKTRRNETMYQQIVGNIVSHRRSKNNIFARGWATYTGDGIQITEAGRQYLRALGSQC